MDFREKLISMLPHKIREDGNGTNIKKLLNIFADYLEADRIHNVEYSNLISINDMSGVELDLYADMFFIYRNAGENDEDLRKRIIKTIILRKTGNTVPAIQGVINQFVTTGSIEVKENHLGLPGNIYIVGDTKTDTFEFVFELVKDLVPAGVRLFVPLFMVGTWQDLQDVAKNHLWEDVNEDIYIW